MASPTTAPPLSGATTSGSVSTGAPAERTGPGAPVAVGMGRHTSRAVADHPLPGGREEQWRFTPLRRLGGLLEQLDHPVAAKVDVVAPDPVRVETVGPEDPRVGSVLTPADRIAALVMAGAPEITVITVPKRTQLQDPVTVTVEAADTGYAHLVIDVEDEARATVVLDHRGDGVLAANVEYRLGALADLTVVSLQDGGRHAVHAGAHAASVGRDARLLTVTVTLGGDLVRLSPTVTYAGSGGDAELLGLFLTGDDQHHEHRLLVEHQAPHCRSRVAYKGALAAAGAHSVWIGDVYIGAAALGTDTYELNRNLVLVDGARADSVPNLEIETGEIVGAGHASATGRFDDEALFYLQSRGIPADLARRLVVRGFFAEIAQRIPVESVRDRVIAAVEQRLGDQPAVSAAIDPEVSV